MQNREAFSAGLLWRRVAVFVFAVVVAAFMCCAAASIAAPCKAHAASNAKLSKQAKKVNKAAKATKGSAKAKLKKTFKYIEKKFGYDSAAGFSDRTTIKKKTGWKSIASSVMSKKKGSCYGIASAYAVCAKTINKKYTVRIGVGKAASSAWNPASEALADQVQDHAWTEVKIGKTWYIYDVFIDKSPNGSNCSGQYMALKRSSAAAKSVYQNFKGVTYKTVKL